MSYRKPVFFTSRHIARLYFPLGVSISLCYNWINNIRSDTIHGSYRAHQQQKTPWVFFYTLFTFLLVDYRGPTVFECLNKKNWNDLKSKWIHVMTNLKVKLSFNDQIYSRQLADEANYLILFIPKWLKENKLFWFTAT